MFVPVHEIAPSGSIVVILYFQISGEVNLLS